MVLLHVKVFCNWHCNACCAESCKENCLVSHDFYYMELQKNSSDNDKSISTDFSAQSFSFVLKGQSHQDLVLLENPIKAMEVIGSPIIVA